MIKNNKSKHSTFEYLKLIFKTDIRYLYVLIIEAFSQVFWSLVPLGLTNYILKIHDSDKSENGYMLVLIVCGIYTLSRVIISTITMYVYNEYTQRIYRSFNEKITTKVLKKVLDVDLLTYQSSDFLNNYQKVVDNITSNMVSTFWDIDNLVGSFISLISIGTILSIINPIIMVYGLLVGIASYFISKVYSKLMHKLSEKNKQVIRERGYVRRVFYLKDCAIDLRTSQISDMYLERNDEYGEEVVNNLKYYYRKLNIYSIIDNTLLNSVFGLALAIVSYTVIKSNDIILLATLISAITYLSDSISWFASSIASYKRGIVYKEDLYRLMDYNSDIEKNDKDLKIEYFDNIEFKDVNFKYDDKLVIEDLNIKINKFDKIAIVGENGAGKTTFIKLLLRLYDPSSGEILFNGINYKEYNSKDIRNQFVTVFQDYQIYAVSIAENVLLRKCECEADEMIVINALKKVGVYEKVRKLEKGIHTICTKEFDESGIEFSGGEKQKFVIARVFASSSPILLLDEPNSALDPLAERHIFDEIFKYSIDKTLIFISHRFSTTILSDKIYLFSDGKILESGNHDNLMNIENGEYKRMFNIQAEEYLKRGDANEEN